MSDFFGFEGDASDFLANNLSLFIEFLHIPTGYSTRFKAYLTDYQDGFTSNWNEEDVYGRMDPIPTFQNTRRQITLGWNVVAGSVDEAKSNLRRCTDLFSMLYPMYDSANASSLSSPPLFKLKFRNLISDSRNGEGLLGKVNGFTFAPDLDMSFVDEDGVLYPKDVALNCDFTVLHTHDMGYSPSYGKRAPDVFPWGVHGSPISLVGTEGKAEGANYVAVGNPEGEQLGALLSATSQMEMLQSGADRRHIELLVESYEVQENCDPVEPDICESY